MSTAVTHGAFLCYGAKSIETLFNDQFSTVNENQVKTVVNDGFNVLLQSKNHEP